MRISRTRMWEWIHTAGLIWTEDLKDADKCGMMTLTHLVGPSELVRDRTMSRG
jgi:hypothetical protein